MVDKNVIELGAGTSLPGVVAAKCGARVTLSDCSRFTKCLDNCHISATANGVGDKVTKHLRCKQSDIHIKSSFNPLGESNRNYLGYI